MRNQFQFVVAFRWLAVAALAFAAVAKYTLGYLSAPPQQRQRRTGRGGCSAITPFDHPAAAGKRSITSCPRWSSHVDDDDDDSSSDAAFSSFADSLEQRGTTTSSTSNTADNTVYFAATEEDATEESATTAAAAAAAAAVTATKVRPPAAESKTKESKSSSTSKPPSKGQSSSSSSEEDSTSSSWQADLEELLDPTTGLARRQVLLSGLLSAKNAEEIRESVQSALRNGKVDPLLTPRAKKIQAGTRAVARQVTNDILPTIVKSSRTTVAGGSRSGSGGAPFLAPPVAPEQLTKVGGRILNALSNQVQRNLETLSGDLADPGRIPGRITRQSRELAKEAGNVFAETPAGLQEPPYTVVESNDQYEIRQYEAYWVASTNMAGADEAFSPDDLGQSGASFNSLAAYLFGANRQGQSMEMTTPVTTTMSGEMRFYLVPPSAPANKKDKTSNAAAQFPPEPLEQDEGRSKKNAYETGSIRVREIPAALLAVRRFTGFCTAGEIARQKESLLAALQLDGVEVDAPHGQTVAHVVFQYNPPYTLPVLRRNEIAVPVLDPNRVEMGVSPKEQWT